MILTPRNDLSQPSRSYQRQVSKDSIDLGIVVTDEKAALGFYRDGFELEWEGELSLPNGRMYRLKCGTTVIKLLKLDKTLEAKPAPGGPMRGLGYRYFTISVPDIRGLMTQLEAKGIRPTVPVTAFRPSVTIAMVTDPDGTRSSFYRIPSRNERCAEFVTPRGRSAPG